MGRSMSSAAMRTRVATRSGSAVGVALGGAADSSGGRVMRGASVGARVAPASGVGARTGLRGDRRRVRQQAGREHGHAGRGEERREEARAHALREVGHRTRMVARVPGPRPGPLVLVPSAPRCGLAFRSSSAWWPGSRSRRSCSGGSSHSPRSRRRPSRPRHRSAVTHPPRSRRRRPRPPGHRARPCPRPHLRSGASGLQTILPDAIGRAVTVPPSPAAHPSSPAPSSG